MTTTADSETVVLDERFEEVDKQLREVRNQLANVAINGHSSSEPGIQLHAKYAELLQMVAKNPSQQRALADVIGTGTGNAEGLVPKAYVSELLGIIDARRPLFSNAGTVAFPSSGYGINFPRVTQHTQVAKRTTEKSEAATRELTVASGEFQMDWFAGAVDVSLELITQSDPSVLEVVVGDLLDQYALATESEFATDTEAAAAVQGGTLDTSSWANFAADVIATSTQIRLETGAPGDRLALTTASWAKVVGLLNPTAPPTLPGRDNPDFTSEQVNVNGILAFHSPESSVDVQFNAKALRKSEKPPMTVTANNVALMGRDIGVIGAIISLPLYPTGIIKYTAA